MGIDPALATMAAHLAELAIPSATATIYNQVQKITAGKANEQTINELKQIINDLINERNDLVAIAQAYEQELVGQRLQDKDIQYIIDSVLPVLSDLVDEMTEGTSKVQAEEALAVVERLLSVEMLTVLQLIGFNYRRAIGEPLTLLLQKLITARIPADPAVAAETERLNAETATGLLSISQDEAATERFKEVLRVWRSPATS